MFCKHCGKEVDQKAEICVHCGTRLRNSFSSFLENSELTQLRPQQTVKSPGLAGFLGFVLGWCLLGPFGYLYLGQWNWFWITIVITIIAYPVTVGVAWVLFPFIFAFHQYQMARELNDMLERSKGTDTQSRFETGGDPRAPHESG
jgi:hypothetical protein